MLQVWDLDIQPEWSSIGCRVTMVGHTDTVRCVHMSSKAGIVISGSYDRSLMIWCLKTGEHFEFSLPTRVELESSLIILSLSTSNA